MIIVMNIQGTDIYKYEQKLLLGVGSLLNIPQALRSSGLGNRMTISVARTLQNFVTFARFSLGRGFSHCWG